jgi:hypothetical protein
MVLPKSLIYISFVAMRKNEAYGFLSPIHANTMIRHMLDGYPASWPQRGQVRSFAQILWIKVCAMVAALT